MINQSPWVEAKITQIFEAVLALGAVGNIAMIVGLPRLTGFSFDNLYGGFFWLSLLNIAVFYKWMSSKSKLEKIQKKKVDDDFWAKQKKSF